MKTIGRSGLTAAGVWFIALVVALVILAGSNAGCASATAQRMTPEQGAAVVRATVASGATIALAKNPRYVELTEAVANGIDVAFFSSAEVVTGDGVRNYVRRVCAKEGATEQETAVLVNLAQTVLTLYQATYKESVVRATNPVVRLYVLAFKEGLNDAVTALRG